MLPVAVVNADCEIFFPASIPLESRKQWLGEYMTSHKSGVLICGSSFAPDGNLLLLLYSVRPRYVLHYYEPGKRANTERQAKRDVHSVQEAVEFMNANKARAFLPASVQTRSWKPSVVAILG